MNKARKWLLAGAAGAAIAGLALAAQAAGPTTHEIVVQLPGGGVEHIRYTGNIKPQIVLAPSAAWSDPFMAGFMRPMPDAWPVAEFTDFDRIAADMNSEMDRMLQQARALSRAAAGGTLNASFANAAPGTVSYSQVTTWTGNGVCTRTMQMTTPESGGKPQLISNTSGDCGSTGAPDHANSVTPAKAVGTPKSAPVNHI